VCALFRVIDQVHQCSSYRISIVRINAEAAAVPVNYVFIQRKIGGDHGQAQGHVLEEFGGV
jgi:hypothetical protein